MTRTMYDATNASRIPAGATMVAGYVDLKYRWSDADWARFPRAVKVRIAASPATNDGHVYDFEPGNDMTPARVVDWVKRRRAAGITPAIYMDAGRWPLVRQIFHNAAVPDPLYWVAHWGIKPVIPTGAIALQYQNTPAWDLNVVADHWPSVDSKPAPPAPAPAPTPAPAPKGEPDMIILNVRGKGPSPGPGAVDNAGDWLLSGSLYVHVTDPASYDALRGAGVPVAVVDYSQHAAILARTGQPTTGA